MKIIPIEKPQLATFHEEDQDVTGQGETIELASG